MNSLDNNRNKPLAVVAAIGKNFELGKNNQLLWHLPNDLRNFKHITLNNPIIMGRKTYQSIGKPLPNRTNIILTKQLEYTVSGCLIAHDWKSADLLAQRANGDKIMAIGGGEIYQQALPLADLLYLTIVNATFADADTFFPPIDFSQWNELSKTDHQPDNQHEFGYSIVEYQRVTGN